MIALYKDLEDVFIYYIEEDTENSYMDEVDEIPVLVKKVDGLVQNVTSKKMQELYGTRIYKMKNIFLEADETVDYDNCIKFEEDGKLYKIISLEKNKHNIKITVEQNV